MLTKFDLNPSSPVSVVVAFQGWNDVAGAAYDAVDHMVKVTKAREWARIDPQEYYDFQVNQPRIEAVDGKRQVVWRTTTLFHTHLDEVGDVIFVRGIEPSYRWLAYLDELLALFADIPVARFLTIGVIPGEVPHTRPFPVQRTSMQEPTRAIYDALAPDYTGPTGFVGVFIDEVSSHDVEALSIWCAVPQYTAGGAQPKATSALVTATGTILGHAFALGDLEEQSRAWERGVAELVQRDPSTSAYVSGLEESRDMQDHPSASGDAIAQEFEQFLRRRGDDGPSAR